MNARLGGVRRRQERLIVFLAVTLTNVVVWLDVAKFGVLTPFWAKDLHLTTVQISSVTAAYLLGYFPLLFLAGILADRIGAKRLLLVCIGGVTVVSGSMAFVHTAEELWIRQLVFGVMFGLLWAPCNRMIAVWFPSQERAKYTAIWMSTTLLSGVIAAPIALPIAHHWSWQAAFLIISALAVPVFVYLWVSVTDRPEDKRGISAEELAYIQSGRDDEARGRRVSWAEIKQGLSQRSVLTMTIATGLATTPTWLTGPWVSYGLINGYKVNPDVVAVLLPIAGLMPVVYGFFNGHALMSWFGGRTRHMLALGPAIGAVAFLAAALFEPSYVVWALLLSGVGFLTDPMFWGTINAYWADLASPELTGTLNGISAALQVAVGYVLVHESGKWINASIQGPSQLDVIWIVGGIVYVLAIIPVYLSREVSVANAGALQRTAHVS